MRLVFLMIAIAVLFLISWGLFGEGLEQTWDIEKLTALFDQSKGWAWLLGIVLLMSDILLPIPGTVVMSALGAVYGFWIGGLLSAIGSMLAGMLGYGVGRFFDEKFARRWLGEKDFDKGRNLFDRSGAWVVAMSRALPILPEVLSCMAGLLRMPFGKFVIALACGAFPMGFLFAWIGVMGREQPAWGIAFSLAVPAVLWGVAAVIRRR